MATANNENCVVDWVKGIRVIFVVAICCIYHTAEVGVYILVISCNSDTNRPLLKYGYDIVFKIPHRIKSFDFDVGSFGGRVLAVGGVVTRVWVVLLEHGIVVFKVPGGSKKVASVAALIFPQSVSIGRAVN